MKTLIFPEHASVLPDWKRRGVTGTTLIYLDAHIDLQFVSQERIEALKNCNTADELAKFEKPHHMMPDVGYSYSIEDFLYPAYCLGMISHLVWVCPPMHDNSQHEQKIQDIFKRLQVMEGVSLENLASFQQVGNIITGKLLGLEVTICGYGDLAGMSLPADSLIDIDIDYFIALPVDEPWIDPQLVFARLKELPLTSDLVTLTRSVSSGYTPLRYSFIADYLAALWQEDRRAAEHYSRLFDLDRQLRQGDREAVTAGCLEEIRQFSDCGATYYLLSLTASDPELARQYARKAADLDPNYRDDILRSINELASRNLEFDSAKLAALEQQLATSEVDRSELALSHFVLGLLHSKLGNLRNVFKHHQIYKKLLDRHPKLNLTLGNLLLQAGQPQRAIGFLRAALQDEVSVCGAHTSLGMIYAKQGDLQQAREHFLKVSEMMPAFSLPVNVLAKIYQQMGDEQNSQFMQKKYQSMQFTNAILAQKFKT
jgi:tetratricopeptide (TPR) repeat protein